MPHNLQLCTSKLTLHALDDITRIPITPRMPHGEYDHLLGVDAIDDAIRMMQNLSVRGLADLGHHAPALREPIQRPGARDQLAEPLRGSLRPILGDRVIRFDGAPLRERRPDDLHFGSRASRDLATAA